MQVQHVVILRANVITGDLDLPFLRADEMMALDMPVDSGITEKTNRQRHPRIWSVTGK